MQPLDVTAYPPGRQWAAQRINEYIAGQEKTKARLDCAIAGLGDWRVRADVEALRRERWDECARRYQEREQARRKRPPATPLPEPRPVTGGAWWQQT